MLIERLKHPGRACFDISTNSDNSHPDAQQQRITQVLRLVRKEVERLVRLHGTRVKSHLRGALSSFITVSDPPGETSIIICVPKDIRLLDRFLDSYDSEFRVAEPLAEFPRDWVRTALTSDKVKTYLRGEAEKGTPIYEIEKTLKDQFGITLTDRAVMALMQQLSCLNRWKRAKERRLDLPRPPLNAAPKHSPHKPKKSRRRATGSLANYAPEIASYISNACANGGCTREGVVAFIKQKFGITTTVATLSTMLSTLRKGGQDIPYIGS